jgi:hypothetical protein
MYTHDGHIIWLAHSSKWLPKVNTIISEISKQGTQRLKNPHLQGSTTVFWLPGEKGNVFSTCASKWMGFSLSRKWYLKITFLWDLDTKAEHLIIWRDLVFTEEGSAPPPPPHTQLTNQTVVKWRERGPSTQKGQEEATHTASEAPTTCQCEWEIDAICACWDFP